MLFRVKSRKLVQVRNLLEKERPMQFYEYKDYTIYPAPQYDEKSFSWRVELVIMYVNTYKKYTGEGIYFTKGEAVFHSIRYGKQLIDNGTVLLKEAV